MNPPNSATLFFSGTRGQSMLIAVAKWIGTLAPTLLLGIVSQFNIYVILTGAICSVFDILYIILLRTKLNEEKKSV